MFISALGIPWITVGKVVMIASIGTVFGVIFEAGVSAVLLNLASGIVMWRLLSGVLNDGAQALSRS